MTDDERQKLDDLRMMLGPDAGNLAIVLEQLTDAMAMVNLHAVYCRAGKDLASGVVLAPRVALDVAEVLKMLEKAKRLTQEVLRNLRDSEQRPPGDTRH